MEKRTSLEQLAPLSGVAFAVLMLAGVFVTAPGSPDFVGPAEDHVRYYTRHDSDIIVGSILLLLSVFALLWFLGSVRRHLLAVEGGDGRLSGIGYSGGVVGAGLLLAAIGTALVPAVRVDDQGTIAPEVAVTFADLSNILAGAAAPMAFAVLVAATAVLGFRTRAAIPRWLTWPSAVLGVVLVVPFISWVGVLLVPLWMLTLSLVIYWQESRAATGAEARPTPALTATAT